MKQISNSSCLKAEEKIMKCSGGAELNSCDESKCGKNVKTLNKV